jgi:hypothetical protein
VKQLEVIHRWVFGEKGRAGALSTFDGKLYSYNLLIGKTVKGKRIVLDYAGQVSGTTTRHVNLAKQLVTNIEEVSFGG